MNKNITISADSLLKMLWNATRYIATRSTYVTSYATDYAALIHRHQDKFNQSRLAFYARDVRMYISDRINWKKNVSVDGDSNDRNNYDAYTLIAGYLESNPQIEFADYDWDVNCITGEVIATKRAEPLYAFDRHKEQLYDMDVPALVKLANLVDVKKHVKVFTEYEGNEREEVCIPYPVAIQQYDEAKHETVGYDYKTVYCPVDRVTSTSWIAPEYIRSVEPLDNAEKV